MPRGVPYILVADDNKDFREVLVAKLKAKGFTTKTASDGREAVTIAKKTLPDLVLMDVEMPHKDGVEATLDLQQDPHTKQIKVLFISNLGDSWPQVTEVNRRLAQQMGAVDYFKKGGDLDELVMKIHEKLGV
jgi:two-component system alkaline phosphatase synthesis response regulator PhoP